RAVRQFLRPSSTGGPTKIRLSIEMPLVAQPRDDQLAHLALLPALRRPWQKVIGMEAVQGEDQAPGQQRYVEPRRPLGRGVNEKGDQVHADEDGEMREEGAHRADTAPGPLLDLGVARLFPYRDSWPQLDRLASSSAHIVSPDASFPDREQTTPGGQRPDCPPSGPAGRRQAITES